ncbi:MAG: leucine-rich repeat domain-containing protein [Muribaculaceae bacterium]|nr:leucine-rich repeat domain-containing protein [Muribaculaceae bacterium]
MNDADWSIISQLTNAKGIDMSNTQIETIPARAFYGKSHLSTVFMPEGLKTIGSEAFCGTNAYHYTIPASVERIGSQAWYDTPLQKIDFAEGSVLDFIGYQAFYSCNLLKEFIMPDSVIEFGTYSSGNTHGYQFYECYALEKLHISDAVTFIPGYFAYRCINMNDLHLPESLLSIGARAFYDAYKCVDLELPNSLRSIGQEAFSCSGLKQLVIPESVTSISLDAFNGNNKLEHLILNSHCNSFASNVFANCTSLKTVVCPVATPPVNAGYYPFNGVTRGNVKLIVPDFAVEDYKLDSYWNKFIIEAGDEASLRDYWYIGNRLTLDKGKRIRNTPEIDMATGSSIWIDGEAAQPFGKFSYSTSESAPAAFLSQTDAVTAEEMINYFYIDTAEKWFFFSPVTDVDFADITNSTTDSWVIRRYNGERRASQNTSSGNWETVTEGKLLRGQGYIVRANKTGWLRMPVAKENHQQFFGAAEATLPIAAYACEDQPANANWNFLGNPYPTCFDIHDMDMEAPITVWTGSTYKALSLSDDRYVLRPMQPFFVQKPEECESLAMLRDGKQLTTTPSNKKAPRRAPEKGRDLINLSIRLAADSLEHDMTRVVLNERASLGYDANRDASKFMSMDLATAQIYSIDAAGSPLAINERPYDHGSVRLGVYLPVRGEQYSISADRMDRDARLYDAVTGLEHSFEYGPYVFTADNEGICDDRFILGFAPEASGVEGMESDAVKVVAGRGSIAVTAPAGAEVAVYGADGILTESFTAAGGTVNVPTREGVNVVTVGAESFTVIVK